MAEVAARKIHIARPRPPRPKRKVPWHDIAEIAGLVIFAAGFGMLRLWLGVAVLGALVVLKANLDKPAAK